MKSTDIIKPEPLSAPIANSGLKNIIPDAATGTNYASVEEGFPEITMKAPKDGGLPPWGQDFNGMFYTMSSQTCFLQDGGLITFDADVSDKIGGYPQGAILDYVDNNGNYYKVQSLIDDNTNNFVTNPLYIDNINWKYLNIVSVSDREFLNISQVSNCLLSVVGGSITTDSYTGVSYVNKDCSVSSNVASGFGAAAYILLNKVFTDAVNFTFEIPFKLNAVGGTQYIAQINNGANGFGVKDGVLFLTYDGAEEAGTIQLQPNIDYTIKLERISAQKAYVLSLKTTGDYTEHLRVVSASGFYAGKSVFLGGGSENFLNGTINLAGVTIKEGSSNYWTVSSAANFQTVTVQGTFNALMPDGLNADKTLNNENATVILDKELLYSPSNGTKTVLVKNDGEVMIRPDYTVSPAEPADQPQGGVWYNTDTNVLAEQTIIYPNIQLINPSGGASPEISDGVLNITLEGQYADLPGTVTLGDNWNISLVLTGEPTNQNGFILGDAEINSGTVMPSGIAINYIDGNITAYFRREDVQVVEKETIISTAYLVAKDSGSTTGYVAAAGEADAFVAENTPVYSDQTMETLIENAPADTWVYSGYSFDNIQTTTGYVKEEGTGQFVAPGIQVYTDANCTTPQATASGTDYQFTGDTAASLIGTLTTAFSNTITLSYNGTQYAFGSQTLTSSDPIKSSCNITLGGISSTADSIFTGINLTTSEFSFWEWNGSSIDTPSYQAFVGAKIGEITDNGDNITATNLDAPLVLAKAADVANRDLSNLTEEGEKHFVNKTQLPPGLLSVPQNIKYTLSNGTFTLKAGSILTVPYGTTDQSAAYPVGATFLNNNFKVAGTSFANGKFFVWAEVQADIVYTSTWMNNYKCFGVIQLEDNYSGANQVSKARSGSTAPSNPTSGLLWYDTTNNFMKRYNNQWENVSFPYGVITGNSTGLTNVITLFNGMGYIGSTGWVDKGITVNISNGVNADGTENNIEKTTSAVQLCTVTTQDGPCVLAVTPAGISNGIGYFASISSYTISETPRATPRWYSRTANMYYIKSGDTFTPDPQAHIAIVELSEGKITGFQPFSPFVAANDNSVVHNYGNETIYGEKTFENPVNANLGLNVTNDNSTMIMLTTDSATVSPTIRAVNNGADAANLAAGTWGFRAISVDKNSRYYSFFENLVDSNNTNRTRIGASRFVNGAQKTASVEACHDASGNLYGTAPTYTANYADTSTKIVTTAYMANHWTTSRATTSSTASKARPAVVVQNYVSGYNWYRVYSDGWIEQGGRAYVYFSASSADAGENVTTISFLKAFTNTNYMPVFTVERYSSEAVNYTDDSTVLIQAVTNNNMRVFCFDGGNNWYHTYIRWYACGY